MFLHRTYPPADIPGGPAHKLSKNYYCDRDVRRARLPPRPIMAAALPELTGEGYVGKRLRCREGCSLHAWAFFTTEHLEARHVHISETK